MNDSSLRAGKNGSDRRHTMRTKAPDEAFRLADQADLMSTPTLSNFTNKEPHIKHAYGKLTILRHLLPSFCVTKAVAMF
jgi:hypothetical protein